MEVITQTKENELSKRFVRDGVAGNYEIIFEMIRVIRDSVNYDLSIKDIAVDILKADRLDSYSDKEKQLKAIFDFVKENVIYIQDQAGLVESIKSARITLSDGYGDCDDISNTIATLVGCLGFEDVRLAMVKYLETDSTFVHIYPVVYLESGERIPLDATLPDWEFGKELTALEIKEIPVFQNVNGLDGLSGWFTNLKHYGKRAMRGAVETIPVAVNFLPIGFVSSTVMASGAQLLNQSATKPLSLNATASKINQELDKIIIALIREEMAIDLATSHALQVSSQLSALSDIDRTSDEYKIIKNSVMTRLEFIKNFEAYAALHYIKIVRLNATAMLALGAAGAAFGGYQLFKMFKGSRN
jgi:hypothetical protein